MRMSIYTKRDWIAALVAFVLVAAVAVGSLKVGLTSWGDDNAAYINEGIAIAESRFNEQLRINYEYHPSSLPDEADDGKLVYVWGFPLMLSLVYRLVGFDRTGYTSIIWYKLPLALNLALLGAVLVLFFRRRFSLVASVFLTLVFCVNRSIMIALNMLYADLTFLFLSMTTLWLMECFADGFKTSRSHTALGVVYGLALFFTHETRLNGITICVVAFIGHVLMMLKKRADRRTLALNLMPYALAAALALAAEHLWLAPATRNTSDMTATQFAFNIQYYTQLLIDWFSELFGPKLPWLGYGVAALCAVGIATGGLGENLHLTLLLAGTFVVLELLYYHQGLRYLYNVLPLLLMYGFQGAAFIAERIAGHWGETGRTKLRRAGCVLALALLALTFSVRGPAIAQNLNAWGKVGKKDVYSSAAIQMYRYIQKHVPADSIICFGKPRMLYLNTGRRSFRWGQNGHDVTEADFYLQYKYNAFGDQELDQTPIDSMHVVKRTKSFTLYRVDK